MSETSGRGVGMSAVRAVCLSLGGSISVHSEQGQGTLFRFDLPLLGATRPSFAAQPSA